MLKLFFFIILLFLIIKYQSPIYHYTVSFPRLFIWLRNNKSNNLKELRERLLSYRSTNKYFDSLEGDKIHKYFTPTFDNSLIIKKDIDDIFDKDVSSKGDSLPYIINMFTTPHTLFGNWVGDSIFRTDYYKRGENNRYKEVYMEALKSSCLQNYKLVMERRLNTVFKAGLDAPLFSLTQKLCIDLTYLLHFGFLPNDDDYKGSYLFIESVRLYAFRFDDIYKQINNLPNFYNRTLKYIKYHKKKDTMVGKWLMAGELSHSDIFMEFIHNILGMAINWTNLCYYFIINHNLGNIPDIPYDSESKKAYIYECFRYILPARFTSSSLKKNETFGLPKNSRNVLVHDLKQYTNNKKYFGDDVEKFNLDRMKNKKTVKNTGMGRCPMSGFFESPRGAKVACDMELLEIDGYMPFGRGYRRCPGEHLSMDLLGLLSKKIGEIEYKLYLKDNVSNPEMYIWGEVDKNVMIQI